MATRYSLKVEVFMKQHFLLGEAARLLRLKPYQVQYALTAGLVEEPKLRIGGKRVFQFADLRRLAAHFGVALPEAAKRNPSPVGGER
jgi:hypothetical protein